MVEKLCVSDYELVKPYVDGDHQCLEYLINRHKSRVFNYLLLLVKKRELAEDLFQDTFIKVIKSLMHEKYQDNGKFLPWVLRIAHNLAIDHFRKEKQLSTVSNDDYELSLFNSKKFAEETVEENMITDQITEDIRSLVDLLPEEQKEVVILRHYAGLSFKEIAEQTQVSINTALGRMRYALINLRKIIEEKELILTR